jgi:hypothetical protein
MSQRCQWHHCAYHSDANVHVNRSVKDHSRKFLTKSVTQRCHWHRCDMHSGTESDFLIKKQYVEFFPKIFEQKLVAQRCQWHRCGTNFVDYLREFEAIFEKALTCVIHSVYQGPRGSCLMKKQRSKIPCQGPFSTCMLNTPFLATTIGVISGACVRLRLHQNQANSWNKSLC